MIYRNVTVPVPEDAYTGSDAVVFVKDKNIYNPKRGFNEVKHTVIGRSIGNGLMYPNTNFRLRYPALFSEASGENVPQQIKRIGLYAVTLSIIQNSCLYKAMHEAFGIQTANALVDFAMYCIDSKSCAAENYASFMQDRLVFSRKILSSYDLSVLFNKEITANQISVFKRKWAEVCKANGAENVWIAIDGSNNDCDAVNVEYAEKGKAKSHNSGNVVSYMYAVNAETGIPVTFDVYRGGRVDSKEVVALIGWLRAFDIQVRGVIIDKGFATVDVFELLDDKDGEFHYPYVAMLKGDAMIHKQMVEDYGNKIRMNYDYMLNRYKTGENSIERKDIQKGSSLLFGIASDEKMKLFSTNNYRTYVSLIYDSKNGTERESNLYSSVTNLARQKQRVLDGYTDTKKRRKKDNPDGIDYSKYLSESETDGRKVIVIDEEALKRDGRSKGFFTLGHTEQMSGEDSYHIYSLRNNSEACFSMVKTQLGSDVERIHETSGTLSKYTLAFIAAIIRTTLVNECKKNGAATNSMINELNHMCISINGKDEYYAVHTENKRQIQILEQFGILPADLDMIAAKENERMKSPEPNPFHSLPVHETSEGKPQRRKPGRPAGSGKKKEHTAKETKKEKPAGRRGRPPGSKNKKTLEKEAQQRRKPGRPKGSPNKPKSEKENKPKRGRGRPRKNPEQSNPE